MKYPQRDRDILVRLSKSYIFFEQMMDECQRIDAHWIGRTAQPCRRRDRAQGVGKIIPALAMSCQQFRKIATSDGAFVGIAGAERGDVTGEISGDGGKRSAEQLDQIGPALAELPQQAVNSAARCLGFMYIVGAKLAEEFDKALALAIIEPPHHGMMSRHRVTPSQFRKKQRLRAHSSCHT